MADRKILEIENAEIIFRNFSGTETDFNAAGNRNFSVKLNDADADALFMDGWNVKRYEPKADDREGYAYLPVAIRFQPFPPKAYIIGSSGRPILLTEDTIGQLDNLEIDKCDLVLVPYHWTLGKKSGTKAYVKEMYVKIVESRFAQKYAIYDDEEVTPFD